jgi:hypothetical protein
MNEFMGYSPSTVFIVLLLIVVLAALVYRNHQAPAELKVVPVTNEPHEEEGND